MQKKVIYKHNVETRTVQFNKTTKPRATLSKIVTVLAKKGHRVLKLPLHSLKVNQIKKKILAVKSML